MKKMSSSFLLLLALFIGFAPFVIAEGTFLMRRQKIVTGTASIEIGSGIEGHHRIAYTAVEQSDIYDNGEKIVQDSWIEAVGLPVSASVPYGVAKILKRGDPVPGHQGTTIGGIWNVSVLCGKQDVAGHCLAPIIVFGAWTQNADGVSVPGLYLFDPNAWDMRLIVRSSERDEYGNIVRPGEEFSSAGIAGRQNFVWDIYNPRAANLERPIVSGGVQMGIDSQILVVADGKCGPTAEESVPCLMAYIEYEHRAKHTLYLIAQEGMEELKSGTLSRPWNTAFFRPGITDGSRFATLGPFSEAGVSFTVVRKTKNGDETTEEQEHRYIAVLTEYDGIAIRTEVCVENTSNTDPYNRSPYSCP